MQLTWLGRRSQFYFCVLGGVVLSFFLMCVSFLGCCFLFFSSCFLSSGLVAGGSGIVMGCKIDRFCEFFW